MLHRLLTSGLFEQTNSCFKSDLSDRSQVVSLPQRGLGCSTGMQYNNSLDHNVLNSNFLFYPDDTVISCTSQTFGLIYMHASSRCLPVLDTVDHGVLGFITSCSTLTHHCSSYTRLDGRLIHWYTFIYKKVLGLLPSYLGCYVIRKAAGTVCVPRTYTCCILAPSSFKVLQKDLNLMELVSLAVFRSLRVVTSSSVCCCFNLAIFYLDYLLMICCD